ncbi:MAG TPA: HU family DNA-binding protein [Acholeplasmataceae bacterium]|jgi:nucleoid DNA-binding protein|nr:HU family DNA-binding protein [Acholeplasmataceae bacterium]
MKKKFYLEEIKARTGISKIVSEKVLEEFFKILKSELQAKGKVNLHKFGTFTAKKTKPHSFFSPVDGKTIKTKGITKVYFSSSKDLLNMLTGADYGNN